MCIENKCVKVNNVKIQKLFQEIDLSGSGIDSCLLFCVKMWYNG